MTKWTTAPVDTTPDTRLVSWLVIQLPDGTRHILGTSMATMKRAVSEPVEVFDFEQLRAITRDGHVYELAGFCVEFDDADSVWTTWVQANHIEAYVDVTDEVWQAHRPALHLRAVADGSQSDEGDAS